MSRRVGLRKRTKRVEKLHIRTFGHAERVRFLDDWKRVHGTLAEADSLIGRLLGTADAKLAQIGEKLLNPQAARHQSAEILRFRAPYEK